MLRKSFPEQEKQEFLPGKSFPGQGECPPVNRKAGRGKQKHFRSNWHHFLGSKRNIPKQGNGYREQKNEKRNSNLKVSRLT